MNGHDGIAALALGPADRDIAKRWLKGKSVFRPAAEIKAPIPVNTLVLAGFRKFSLHFYLQYATW